MLVMLKALCDKISLLGGIFVSILDSLFTALFCMSVVFAMLGGLYALVNLFTNAIRFIEAEPNKRRQPC